MLNEPLCEPCISRHARPFRLLRWTQVQRHTANLQRAKQFASRDLAVSEDFWRAVRVSLFPYLFFDSKFATRHLDWEVIIVDDASPDGTQEIAKQLAKVYGEDKIVGFYYSCYCQ